MAGVFTIEPGRPFCDVLAGWLLDFPRQEDLGRILCLFPGQRAARLAEERFLALARGKCLPLPSFRAIGDTAGMMPGAVPAQALGTPPAIPALSRRIFLMRLIRQHRDVSSLAAALALSDSLGDLLDEISIGEVDFNRLDELVPGEYALHWQNVLSFLDIARKIWPRTLADMRMMDPAARQVRLLSALAFHWESRPPDFPVVIAGSTGSWPAVARLMAAVASQPEGRVILPGLDTGMEPEEAMAIRDSPAHPQAGMMRLLDRLGLAPGDVRVFEPRRLPLDDRGRARNILLREAMQPPSRVFRWRESVIPPAAFAGMRLIETDSPGQEADIIAILLRQTLETPGRRAGLVTGDPDLLRRVRASLAVHGVHADESAGTPLGQSPAGSFLRLGAECLSRQAAPVPMMALLKHPFACLSLERGVFLSLVRRLERLLLRGRCQPAGFGELRENWQALCAGAGEGRTPDPDGAVAGLLARLEQAGAAFAQLASHRQMPFARFFRAHMDFIRALVATGRAEPDLSPFRQDAAGEAALALIDGLELHAGDIPAISGADYAGLFALLMEGQEFRSRYGNHPRLAILGPLESRLQHPDLFIIGGLDEESWPLPVPADPWFSRGMREVLGLPLPEWRAGQSAHDFVQVASAPEVVLTRSRKQADGSQGCPSRFLVRLLAVARGAIRQDTETPALARRRYRSGRQEVSLAPPAPCPPLSRRPRRLSVTDIDHLVTDPYAVYARRILCLEPLDPLGSSPEPRLRGEMIHRAMELFVRENMTGIPDEAGQARLLELLGSCLAPLARRPGAGLLYESLPALASQLVEFECRRRRGGRFPLAVECGGEISLSAGGEEFVLRGRADRIDRLEDGRLAIIDYKTGKSPSARAVRELKALQLPLEGMILARGGFGDVPPGQVGEYLYLTISPFGKKPEQILVTEGEGGEDGDGDSLAMRAGERLEELVAHFLDPATPFLFSPRPRQRPAWNGVYRHLARPGEWRNDGGG